MDREVVLPDRTVVIRDGRIEAVTATADVDTRQMQVIDGRGKWLMPALSDMHAHFWDPTEANLFLANGIAHVRNMWGTSLHLGWRRKVMSGAVAGPRLTTTGPIVDGPGPDGRTIWPGSVLLAAPEEAGPLVNRIANRGYAQVKALSALQLEPLRALGAAAKARGIPVTGHCPRSVRYEEAIDAGMSCFEHLAAIDNCHVLGGESQPPTGALNWLERLRRLAHLDLDRIRVLAARMAREQIWNCPTLVVLRQITLSRDDSLATPHLEYVRPHTRDSWDPKDDFRFRGMPFTREELVAAARAADEVLRRVVGILRDEGAPLLLGTDTPNPYVVAGFSIHQELGHLRASGLSPYEVFLTGTSEAARFLGEEKDWGTVTPGRRADLVLVSRDPLRYVDAVRHIEHLFVNGHDFDRAALDSLLTERLNEVTRELDPITIGADDTKWIVTHSGRPFGRLTTRRRQADEGTRLEEVAANFQWGETRRRATAILDADGSLKDLTATTDTGFGSQTLSIARTAAGYSAHLTEVDGAVSDTTVASGPAPLSPRLLVSASESFVSATPPTALTFEDERLILASVSASTPSAPKHGRTVTFSRPGEMLEFVLAFNEAGEISRVSQRMALGVREWVVETEP
jgi:imidazolonepropionase-like amidohydrolase